MGGVADHVHLLVRFGRTIAIADFIKEFKRVSTLWVQSHSSRNPSFYWQSGYGVFSVSSSNVAEVIDYIRDQETRHRKLSFQDECRALLNRHEIDFDEKFVWD